MVNSQKRRKQATEQDVLNKGILKDNGGETNYQLSFCGNFSD
jgi:hypothetical protein